MKGGSGDRSRHAPPTPSHVEMSAHPTLFRPLLTSRLRSFSCEMSKNDNSKGAAKGGMKVKFTARGDRKGAEFA